MPQNFKNYNSNNYVNNYLLIKINLILDINGGIFMFEEIGRKKLLDP